APGPETAAETQPTAATPVPESAEVIDIRDARRDEARATSPSGPAASTSTAAPASAVARRPAAPTGNLAARQFALQQHIARHAYDTVRKLLSESNMQAARVRALHATEPEVPIANEVKVEEALSSLQRSLDAQSLSGDLSERVSAAINDGGEAPLQVDHDVLAAIDVIHHLFEGIISNPVLSGRVKEAIKRLEVPFLRLLLVDDPSLTEEPHPARQMLNRMAHLGVRGSANLAAHEQEIDHEVTDVLQHFDRDVDVFSRALEKLDKLAGRQQTLYQRNIKRVTESYE